MPAPSAGRSAAARRRIGRALLRTEIALLLGVAESTAAALLADARSPHDRLPDTRGRRRAKACGIRHVDRE